MTKSQRNTPRKPATKFPSLRKKMQKVQVKKPKKKCATFHGRTFNER
jgi:hypothetical protein